MKAAGKNQQSLQHANLEGIHLAVFRTRVCEQHRNGRCPNSDRCPHSHCQTWQRRNPNEYSYSSKLCPEIEFVKRDNKMTLMRRCSRGRGCSFAHSKEEELYHPSVYKTKICNSQPYCTRYYCPFAHSAQEIRTPSSTTLIQPSPSEKCDVNGSTSRQAIAGQQPPKRWNEVVSGVAYTASADQVMTLRTPGSPLSSSSTTASSAPSPVLACLSPATAKTVNNQLGSQLKQGDKAWSYDKQRRMMGSNESAYVVTGSNRRVPQPNWRVGQKPPASTAHPHLSFNQDQEGSRVFSAPGLLDGTKTTTFPTTFPTTSPPPGMGHNDIRENDYGVNEEELKTVVSTVASLFCGDKTNPFFQEIYGALQRCEQATDKKVNTAELQMTTESDGVYKMDSNQAVTSQTLQQLIASLESSPSEEETSNTLPPQQHEYSASNWGSVSAAFCKGIESPVVHSRSNITMNQSYKGLSPILQLLEDPTFDYAGQASPLDNHSLFSDAKMSPSCSSSVVAPSFDFLLQGDVENPQAARLDSSRSIPWKRSTLGSTAAESFEGSRRHSMYSSRVNEFVADDASKIFLSSLSTIERGNLLDAWLHGNDAMTDLGISRPSSPPGSPPTESFQTHCHPDYPFDSTMDDFLNATAGYCLGRDSKKDRLDSKFHTGSYGRHFASVSTCASSSCRRGVSMTSSTPARSHAGLPSTLNSFLGPSSHFTSNVFSTLDDGVQSMNSSRSSSGDTSNNLPHDTGADYLLRYSPVFGDCVSLDLKSHHRNSHPST